MSRLAALLAIAIHAPALADEAVITGKPSHMVALSGDGRVAAIATADSIIAFDLMSEGMYFELPLDDEEPPTALATSLSSRTVAWGTASGAVRLLRLPSGDDRGTIRAVDGAAVTSLGFNEEGAMLAVGTSKGGVSVWLSRNSAARATFEGLGAPVTRVAFMAGEPALLLLPEGGALRRASLTDFAAPQLDATDTSGTLSFDYCPKPSLFVRAESDGTIRVAGVSSPETSTVLPLKRTPGSRIRASADAGWLAVLAPGGGATYVRMANGRRTAVDGVVDAAISSPFGYIIEVGGFGARLRRPEGMVPKERVEITEVQAPLPPPADPDDDGHDHEGHGH